MGFLTGKAAWVRFRVSGVGLTGLVFGDDHLDRLRESAAGRQKVATADGVEVGWAAGDSVLDADFAAEKNVWPEHLAFDFLVEQDRIPGDLLRAYQQAELKALTASNPSGFASARQKREAKEAARERVEQEAKDGRFRRRKAVPVLWDARRQEVLFGSPSLALVERFCSLFEQTFQATLEFQSAGRVADRFLSESSRSVICHSPVAMPHVANPDVSWSADESSHDYLGNEFLLWLLYLTAAGGDTVAHPAGDIAVMASGSLLLDCPRGQSGQDTFRHEMPVRLPEVHRALAAGKLPRKAGLTLVRHDRQFGLTLQAETFAFSGVTIPRAEDATGRATVEARLEAVRDCVEAVDDLCGVFAAVRDSNKAWLAYLADSRRWLGTEGRPC